jgi:uncharacterized protein (DUF433 family)
LFVPLTSRNTASITPRVLFADNPPRTIAGGILPRCGYADCSHILSPEDGPVPMDRSRIVSSNPQILGGEPVFTGTRVPVRTLLVYLEGGETLEEFLDNFPTVSREQAIAFLEESASSLLAQIA